MALPKIDFPLMFLSVLKHIMFKRANGKLISDVDSSFHITVIIIIIKVWENSTYIFLFPLSLQVFVEYYSILLSWLILSVTSTGVSTLSPQRYVQSLIDIPFWFFFVSYWCPYIFTPVKFRHIYTAVIEGKIWPFDINGIIVEMNLFHLDHKIFPCKSILPVPKSSLKMFFEFPPSCQYVVDAEILRTDWMFVSLSQEGGKKMTFLDKNLYIS